MTGRRAPERGGGKRRSTCYTCDPGSELKKESGLETFRCKDNKRDVGETRTSYSYEYIRASITVVRRVIVMVTIESVN